MLFFYQLKLPKVMYADCFWNVADQEILHRCSPQHFFCDGSRAHQNVMQYWLDYPVQVCRPVDVACVPDRSIDEHERPV